MIRAEFSKNSATGTITKVIVSGHADQDVYGKDIVCASVSTLFIAICNGLEEQAGVSPETSINEAHSQFSFDPDMLDETQALKAQTLMQTFLSAMQGLAREHKEYIKVLITEE